MKNEDSFEGGTLRSYCFDMPGKIKGTKFVANYIINPFIYFPRLVAVSYPRLALAHTSGLKKWRVVLFSTLKVQISTQMKSLVKYRIDST